MGDTLSLIQFADRVGLNVAALFSIGFALHSALGVVERDAFQRLRRAALLSGLAVLVFAGARLVILTAQMGDGTTLLDPDLLALAWTALGPSTLALAAGAVAATAGMLIGSRLVAGLGAISLSISFGLTGHTQGLAEPGLMPALVAVHVLVAGFWIAAPVTLHPRGTLTDDVLLKRLRRFSAIAAAAIPVLIGLGLWLGVTLAGGVTALLSSPYGLLLMAKLVAAGLAMGAGAFNKQVVTRRVASDPPRGRVWLARTLMLETSLFAVAVLAISAATTIAGPGE